MSRMLSLPMLFLIVSVGLSSDLLQLMMGSVEPDLTLCLPFVLLQLPLGAETRAAMHWQEHPPSPQVRACAWASPD